MDNTRVILKIFGLMRYLPKWERLEEDRGNRVMCLDLLSLKSLSDIQVEMSKFRVNLQN